LACLGASIGNLECVRTADLDLKCWGTSPSISSAYPVNYKDHNNVAVSGLKRPLSGSYGGLAYVDPSGVVNFNGAPMAVQPPCDP
ncbi:MAG TPA: hypothetical protein VGF76_12300, partial [Polyangiaceae bacterium]